MTEANPDTPVAHIRSQTRRLAIVCLTFVAVMCIGAEVALAIIGATGSDALMAVASGAVGAIGGMIVSPELDNNDPRRRT
jgi:hypothetical protein